MIFTPHLQKLLDSFDKYLKTLPEVMRDNGGVVVVGLTSKFSAG